MTPIICRWNGENLEPLQRFRKACDEQFVIGEVYPLAVTEQRSMKSHGFYFASLSEAFDNLPDDFNGLFADIEAFRKRGLIECGYFNQREFVAASAAEAKRLVKFLAAGTDYAVYSVTGCAVVERTAKSQSMKAMGKRDFEASKQAVLGWAWGLCGITPEQAAANVGRAA
jgi:hypothetical protein